MGGSFCNEDGWRRSGDRSFASKLHGKEIQRHLLLKAIKLGP